jgi:type IV pilus assembly protein PilV
MLLENLTNMSLTSQVSNKIADKRNKESGFSLLEVIVAMLIMTILLLGTLTVFTYTVQYNRGNNLRSQALTVLQQESEIYRSSKFTSAMTDSALLGGNKPTKNVNSADGTPFTVITTVDNDPSTDGVQSANDTTCTLKEVKIFVSPKNMEAPWQTAIITDVTIQRVRGN